MASINAILSQRCWIQFGFGSAGSKVEGLMLAMVGRTSRRACSVPATRAAVETAAGSTRSHGLPVIARPNITVLHPTPSAVSRHEYESLWRVCLLAARNVMQEKV